MKLQQLLQNSAYSQKFVLEKLIQEYLGYSREAIRLHLDTDITDEQLQQIHIAYQAYSIDKKPLEYILGHVDFFGVPFYVNEHTIIPRPETEYMITAVTEYLNSRFLPGERGEVADFYTLLDIGTGSGILGISILLQNPDTFEEVYLSDISPEALNVAKKNYDTLIPRPENYHTHFLQANLLSFLEERNIASKSTVLVANLPYIPDETFDNNALENVQKREPRLAFVGGNDGLEYYREMFRQLKSIITTNSLKSSDTILGNSPLMMFLEMMTRQIEILKAEFGDRLDFEEVKTFHFNIRIVKAWIKKQTFFDALGVLVPEMYLPTEKADRNKRAVVACDQYTSQPEYRESVEQYVANAPSTLHITLPELYLKDPNKSQRIANIQQYMQSYLTDGTLKNQGVGFILLDRKTSHTSSRKGLMLALDLEKYDYSVGSQSLIRATEGTILDRLPPRIQIRKEALLETPHIMVLIDDPNQQVIEPLFSNLAQYPKLYDFDLMMEGGHITGYHITDQASIQSVMHGLTQLTDPDQFRKKYGIEDERGVLLFAMGDGNHSFATAKALREEKKKSLTETEKATHPARFALVEINNVHDEGITFEPIHRVLFNVNASHFFAEMQQYFTALDSPVVLQYVATKEEAQKLIQQEVLTSDSSSHQENRVHHIRGMTAEQYFIITIPHPPLTLEVGTLQQFLDTYLAHHPETQIDYVHGEEITEELGKKEGNMGLLLPKMHKSDFFKTVILEGTLPRKTFSMGEAEEKRFYLECRKINQ